jgi:phosphatidate cytidylyltransferase
MKTRILTSLVAVCILIPVLIFSHTIVFPIALAIASTICIFEMTNCVGQKKLAVTLPIYAMSVASPFLVRYISMQKIAAIAFICIGAYLLYMFTLIITSHGKLTFSDAISNFAICLYIIIACAAINYIRDFGANGKYIYFLIFLGAWVTDIFAYFSGVFFGKHKLIPDVSPKKTIEGSIGGTLFCAISYIVFGLVVGFVDKAVDPNLIFLFIGGIIIAIISQIGDLIMSVIKRHYGIKDYGKIFPGHGGMLDRFDSILAVSLGIAMLLVFSTLIGVNIL